MGWRCANCAGSAPGVRRRVRHRARRSDRVQESRAKSAPSEQFADANAAHKCSHSVKYFKYELPAPHDATRLLQATPQKPDSARQAPSFAAVAWRLREHMYLYLPKRMIQIRRSKHRRLTSGQECESGKHASARPVHVCKIR